jgi:uncharacterized Zn ribbon protein
VPIYTSEVVDNCFHIFDPTGGFVGVLYSASDSSTLVRHLNQKNGQYMLRKGTHVNEILSHCGEVTLMVN